MSIPINKNKLISESKSLPTIAVLMAAYNGRKWIEEQIFSILKQKDVSISLFISVDISSDDTYDLCLEIQKKNTNITVLSTKTTFGSAKANFFRLIKDVRLENFNYIAFADQDDIWLENKLIVAVNTFKKKQIDGYSSNVIAFWKNKKKALIDKAQPLRKWDYLFESAGPGCTFVLKTDLCLKIQHFLLEHEDSISEIWAHDWFIYAFSRTQGYKWYIDPQPTMLYRQHDQNQVGVNKGFLAFLHRSKFVLEGKALSQSILLCKIFKLTENPFIKKWHTSSKLGLAYLAINAKKCRRKPSEQLIFAASCLILAAIGKKK